MKKNRTRLPLVIFAVALLCLGAYFILSLSRQPLHKDKPIQYWVDNACIGMDSGDRWTFRKELRNIGTPATPYLIRNLRATYRWRDNWNAFRTHLPDFWQQHFAAAPSAQELHYGAAATIQYLGPIAKSAVPDLIPLIQEIPNDAIYALRSIGPDACEALPALRLMLTNQNIDIRLDAASAIWRINRETNLVLDIYTNTLAQSPKNAMNACAFLSDMGRSALPAAPFVLQVLQDTNSNARGNAAIVLGNVRLSTPEIRQALLDGLKEEHDKGLRDNCALALWAFDPDYAPLGTRFAIESIAEERKRFPNNQDDFTEWLKYRELNPIQSVPTLRQLLTNESPEIRAEAAKALAKIESDAKTSDKK